MGAVRRSIKWVMQDLILLTCKYFELDIFNKKKYFEFEKNGPINSSFLNDSILSFFFFKKNNHNCLDQSFKFFFFFSAVQISSAIV